MKRAVVAIVNHDSYILLGKKIKKEKKFFSERWHIPGETLEDGETDEQGLRESAARRNEGRDSFIDQFGRRLFHGRVRVGESALRQKPAGRGLAGSPSRWPPWCPSGSGAPRGARPEGRCSLCHPTTP